MVGMNLVKRLFREEEGQAMTEYGLLVGLISIAAIAAIVIIGNKLLPIFQKVADSLPTL